MTAVSTLHLPAGTPGTEKFLQVNIFNRVLSVSGYKLVGCREHFQHNHSPFMMMKFPFAIFQKPVKKIFGLIILVSLSLFVSANGYVHPAPDKVGVANPYQNELLARMFLITVIDSNDETIGERCETDLDQMVHTFNELADWLFMEMQEPKIIKGDEFSKEGVNDAIDNWLGSQQLTKKDIVVFYYSGHGFNYPGDASDYPRMWLKTTTDKNTQTANLRMEEDIYNRIVAMGAGVNIVLSDCCNTAVAGENAAFDGVNVPVRKRVTHKREKSEQDDSDEEIDAAEKLFTPSQPFSMLATAAGKGELAGGKADTGGFFTNFLMQALEDCIYETTLEPTWESIFQFINQHAGYWAKSAACPQAKHNDQGRCIQEVKFKIDNPD